MRLLLYNLYFLLVVTIYSVCAGRGGSAVKDKGRRRDISYEIKTESSNISIALQYVIPKAKIQLLYPRGFCISVPGKQRGQHLIRKIECHVNINKPFKTHILGIIRGMYYFRERSTPYRWLYRFFTTTYEFNEGDHLFILLIFMKKDPMAKPMFFYEEAIVAVHRRGYLELSPMGLPQTTMPSIADQIRPIVDAHPYNISYGINKKVKPRPKKPKRKRPLPVKAAKKLRDKTQGKVG